MVNLNIEHYCLINMSYNNNLFGIKNLTPEAFLWFMTTYTCHKHKDGNCNIRDTTCKRCGFNFQTDLPPTLHVILHRIKQLEEHTKICPKN